MICGMLSMPCYYKKASPMLAPLFNPPFLCIQKAAIALITAFEKRGGSNYFNQK